ncbi:MAG: hypothetical protein HY064_07690 [Bacteroidetes bacterium]|nr:hypothetical protein [Bacteroidota bacterium]
MKKIIFVSVIFFLTTVLHSQTCVSLRYFGLTMHPMGDNTASIQPYRLDDRAVFVANFGGFASVDHYFFYDQLAITVMQGIFTDCSGGPAGFTHIGIRGLLLDKGKHRILLGIGPMLYYRRDWNRFSEYHDTGFFSKYHSHTFGDVQYKIFPLGGEFAWHWEFSDHFDLNAGFTPGFPLALSFSAGLTWWPQRFATKYTQPKIHLRKKKKSKDQGMNI